MNKPPMPDQPKTKEIPAVVPQVPATIDAVLRELRQLYGVVDGLAGQIFTYREETRVELAEMREHIGKHSIQVRGESKTNLEQDAAIASIVVDVGAVKTELAAVKTAQATAATERAETAAKVTEIRDAVVKSAGLFTKVLTHPRTVFVGRVIFVLAAGYAAAHGLGVAP